MVEEKKKVKKPKFRIPMTVYRVPKNEKSLKNRQKDFNNFLKHRAGKIKKDRLKAIHVNRAIAKRRKLNKNK